MAVATPEICVTLLQLSPNNPQLKKKKFYDRTHEQIHEDGKVLETASFMIWLEVSNGHI